MKLLLVIAPERFRDEELFVPMRIFEEAGIGCEIASTRAVECSGMLGGSADATIVIDDADASEFEGIVVIGGMGAQDFLWTHKGLIALVRDFYQSGKTVAAICLAPVVLAKAGILKGRQATVFRSPASVLEMKNGGADLVRMPVVADMNIITAEGPQFAGSFAELILEKLGC